MLVACWSVKGGSGTTVVSAAVALLLARSASGALLVDLAGDAPAVLGIGEPSGPGLSEWLAAGPEVGADALARIEVPATATLGLLPAGRAVAGPGEGRADALAVALASEPRPVVIDCGIAVDGAAMALAAASTVSLLVIRPCYLALRRALAAPLRPSGIVLVTEPERALGRADVEDVLGVPVRAEVAVEPSVARAVDAGLLASRLPRRLERSLRAAT